MKKYKFEVAFEVEGECECRGDYDFIDVITSTLQEVKGVHWNVRVKSLRDGGYNTGSLGEPLPPTQRPTGPPPPPPPTPKK